jgi:hypothetical protein
MAVAGIGVAGDRRVQGDEAGGREARAAVDVVAEDAERRAHLLIETPPTQDREAEIGQVGGIEEECVRPPLERLEKGAGAPELDPLPAPGVDVVLIGEGLGAVGGEGGEGEERHRVAAREGLDAGRAASLDQ